MAGRTDTAFKLYAAFYIVLVTMFSLLVWVFIRAAGHLATGIAFDLREQGFERLQELSFSYYDTRPTGWLVSRLTSDCTKISSLLPWFMLDLSWERASLWVFRSQCSARLATCLMGVGDRATLVDGQLVLPAKTAEKQPTRSADELDHYRGLQRRVDGCPHDAGPCKRARES